MPQKYMTRAEQARYLTEERGLPTTKNYLTKLASVGGGPRYCLFGNRAVSTIEWLDEWADAKLSTPRRCTSEAA